MTKTNLTHSKINQVKEWNLWVTNTGSFEADLEVTWSEVSFTGIDHEVTIDSRYSLTILSNAVSRNLTIIIVQSALPKANIHTIQSSRTSKL